MANEIEKYDEHAGCKKQIFELERFIGMLETKFTHLQQIYNKLADQWNVFQSTNRPDNRNIQRAEGAGEMARKLGEIFLSLAYDTDARDLITNLLEKLREAQDPAGGQVVEVTRDPKGQLVVPHRVK